MDTAVATTYTVALRDYPGLPLQARMQAEIRYCQALERRLGSADAVAATFRAVIALQHVAEPSAGPVADADTPVDAHASNSGSDAVAMRWRLANMAAHQVGLQGLPALAGASFEVSLV